MSDFKLCIASYNNSIKTVQFRELTKIVDIVVVNQYDNPTGICSYDEYGVNVINQDILGLSNSRNTAMDYCNGNLIFSDDDIIYDLPLLKEFCDQARNMIDKGFDFITFNNSHDSGPCFQDRQHSLISVFRVPSWTICISSKVVSSSIRFDTNFGINGFYGSGEENIFLYDLLYSGFLGVHVDIAPVKHSDVSTGFIWNSDLARTKGALFRRTFGGGKGFILLLLFMLKKTKEYHYNIYFAVTALKEYFLFRRNM